MVVEFGEIQLGQNDDRGGLALLTVVLPPDRVRPLLDGLRALLAEHSGVLLVSDTWVSRPEYFRR